MIPYKPEPPDNSISTPPSPFQIMLTCIPCCPYSLPSSYLWQLRLVYVLVPCIQNCPLNEAGAVPYCSAQRSLIGVRGRASMHAMQLTPRLEAL